MLSKKMEEALNGQINAELYSAYLYLSMQAYFESGNLPGFANWMHIQTQEEWSHAMKLYDFVNSRGGKVTLKSIDEPPRDWASAAGVFEATYAHEQKVSGLIDDLVDLAISEKDHATNIFLQWFVSEQVEEEENASDILGKLKLVEGSSEGVYMLDKEMGQRVFVPPAGAEG